MDSHDDRQGPLQDARDWGDEHLLGEFETHLVQFEAGSREKDRHCAVWLQREPKHPRDPWAIRAENRQCGLSGYLPGEVAQWLAPLLDRRAIRVEAVLPAGRAVGKRIRTILTVFARPEAARWFIESEVNTGTDALHDLVRRSYQQCQRSTNPEAARAIAEGLAHLHRAPLRPESRLLIALLPAIARECLAARSVAILAAVRLHLSGVRLGPPHRAGGLVLFPLMGPTGREPEHLLLADVMDSGDAEVREAGESGSIARLLVVNRGDRPLLIPEGEILVGAKQNRVVNATVLVAAQSEFELPVSCVEQGRWGYQTRTFRSAFWAPPRLRSRKVRSVQQRRNRDGRAESDQSGVWSDVDRYLSESAVSSSTNSLADGYVANEDRLRLLREDASLPEAAAGVLVARGKDVLGIDLFDSPTTFGRLWPRIADAYFLESLRLDSPCSEPPLGIGERFLERLIDSARYRSPPLGLGDEVEFAAAGIIGAGLFYRDRLCHLAAFAEA